MTAAITNSQFLFIRTGVTKLLSIVIDDTLDCDCNLECTETPFGTGATLFFMLNDSLARVPPSTDDTC